MTINNMLDQVGNVTLLDALNVDRIYVSKVIGDDLSGDGSIVKPFASIQAGVTAAGSPIEIVIVEIIDAAEYDESVVISQNNIFIQGNFARILVTGPGDAITVSSGAGAIHVINLGGLETSGGGKTLSILNDEGVILKASFLVGGDVDVNNGFAIINSLLIVSSLVISGTGGITYSCISGTITETPGAGSITGITPNGTTASAFSAKGDLVAGGDAIQGALQSYPSTTASGLLSIECQDNLAAVTNFLRNQPTTNSLIWELPDFDSVTYGSNTIALMPSKKLINDPGANLISFDTTITAAALAGAASFSLMFASAGAQYRIRELYINAGLNFSGLGDRNVSITDGVTTYSIILAANLIAMPNSKWGDAALPYPVGGIAINAPTSAGVNLSVVYSGGAVDWAAGSISLSGIMERVV